MVAVYGGDRLTPDERETLARLLGNGPKTLVVVICPVEREQAGKIPAAWGKTKAARGFSTTAPGSTDEIDQCGYAGTRGWRAIDVDIDALYRRMDDRGLECGIIRGGDVYTPTQARSQLFRDSSLAEIVDVLRRIGSKF